jgi:hypothetical protein
MGSLGLSLATEDNALARTSPSASWRYSVPLSVFSLVLSIEVIPCYYTNEAKGCVNVPPEFFVRGHPGFCHEHLWRMRVAAGMGEGQPNRPSLAERPLKKKRRNRECV